MKKSLSVILLSMLLGACSAIDGMAPRVDFPDERKEAQAPKDSAQPAFEKPAARTPDDAQYYRAQQERATAMNDGGIFNPYTYSGLFEDRRARQVGDLLTIEIVEVIDSRQNNSTSVSTSDEIALNTPSIGGLFNLRAVDKRASSSKDFQGDGSTRANNVITGTVSVVVTEVMPSGNMRVKGERQIGTNREVESIKFYGVVNPDTIRSGNRVTSSEVSDARIEYRGKGAIDSAQAMGWMSRFFLSVLPF